MTNFNNNIGIMKKILIAIIIVIVAIRIGYIMVRGEVDKEYIKYSEYDFSNIEETPCKDLAQEIEVKNKSLKNISLIFNNVSDDKLGSVILCLYSKEKLLYKSNISLANIENNEWIEVFVNAELDENTIYTVTLTSSEDCSQIPNVYIVYNHYSPEIIESYISGQSIKGTIAINYGSEKFPSLVDRMVITSLWILFGICLIILVLKYEYLKDIAQKLRMILTRNVNEHVLLIIIELIICKIIIGCSGIEFKESTKVILLIISLISSIGYNEKNKYACSLVDVKWKKILLILLYFYGAFSLVGQRLWIYPLDKKINIAEITVYLLTVVWFIPVIKSLLYYFNRVILYLFTSDNKGNTIKFVVLSNILLIMPAAYNLFANNPGISSVDSSVCMIENAKHLHGMWDWMPFFYCFILNGILKIWDSTYMVILVQYFFYMYVFTELLLFLRNKKFREEFLYLLAIVTGFNAGNYIHINTIWKDVPYTLSLLWVLIIIAKLTMSREIYIKSKYIYLEFIIAMIGTGMYRKNGIVSFIIISIFLLPIMKNNYKLILSLMFSVLLIVLIKGPLYSYYEVEKPGRVGIYIGLGQDILGAYYNGGEVNEETLAMITNMTDYNNAEYNYNPTYAEQSYAVYVEPAFFIKNYIKTFINNPVIMLRAIIDREDALWDIFAGEDCRLECVNYTLATDYGQWREYYPDRKFVSLYVPAQLASTYTAENQWISAVEWRCGVLTLLSLIATLNIILKGHWRGLLPMLSPMMGHILSLLLSTGWSDFRYFWPMNLLNISYIIILFTLLTSNNDVLIDKN